MAVRFWRAIKNIMSDRCKRRKTKVNYKALNDDSSDDDFSPSMKRSKQQSVTRLSRDDRQFVKDTRAALEVSKKTTVAPMDTSLVIANDYAEDMSISDDHQINNGGGCHGNDSDDDSYHVISDGGSDSDQDDDDFELIKQPLIKEKPKKRPTRLKPIKQQLNSVKENISPDPLPDISLPDPSPTDNTPDPVYIPQGDEIVSLSRPLPVVKQSKRPYWTPPARITGSNSKSRSSSPLSVTRSSSGYHPVPGNLGVNGSSGGVRVGLSRNVRVKSLHQNIKTNENQLI